MSEVKVNKISPRSGTDVTLGDSGDTFTIPSGATINNQGTAVNFGATGSASWVTTVKTGDFTAVAGEGYFVNTTSGEIDVTLPAGTAGAVIAVADYANTADTNNIILKQNGSDKIEGSTDDLVINQEGVSITLVYVDATKGWITTDTGNSSDAFVNQNIVATGGTILTSGDFKTHVFTGPGTFTVTNAGTPLGSDTVEYLVVAGGGSGGSGDNGGGAGAGGYRQNYPSPVSGGLPVSIQGYTVTVGAGGAAVTGNVKGNNGVNSTFSTITSAGGGRGGGSAAPGCRCGGSGGSGGGGGWPSGSGGAGNTPATPVSQGNPGGSNTGAAPLYASGGGGGASAAGTNGTASIIGNGGNGAPIATTFFGPTAPSYGTSGPAAGRYFAGGAAGNADCGTSGTAGAGGGGLFETNGTVNTGGGGGGSHDNATSGGGGSGIVVIRYKFQN